MMPPDRFDALSQLLRPRPDSQARELVRLVLVDGLTQADAARQLGATEQAASNALRAARATLELASVAVGPSVGFDSHHARADTRRHGQTTRGKEARTQEGDTRQEARCRKAGSG